MIALLRVNCISPCRRSLSASFRKGIFFKAMALPNDQIVKKFSKKRVSYREGMDVQLTETKELGKVMEIRGGGWFMVKIFDSGQGLDKIVKVRSTELSIHEAGEAQHVEVRVTTPTPDESLNEVEYKINYIEANRPHLNTAQWIVFSDLHVKESSIETCEIVLSKVHEAAVSANAGIIFLGDFWHVRGSLSVDLLNRVLRCFEKWSQPVILIPGNHDQVTLGGTVHALEPLKYAFKEENVMLLSEPVVCLGALWVPYRRDHKLLQSILKAGAQCPDVTAIFCHADVRGAFMNDGMTSREGLDISDFPPNMPIFSGHFHKPHSVVKGKSSLRYVGSPYQTSLSEAGQTKFLYRLSCLPSAESSVSNEHTRYRVRAGAGSGVRLEESGRVWREEERWPLVIGRKYFKASSVRDPLVASVRPGDRLVVSVRPGEDVRDEVDKLRSSGVEVDIREVTERVGESSIANSTSPGESEMSSSTPESHETSPIAMYTTYLNVSLDGDVPVYGRGAGENADEADDSSIKLKEAVYLTGRAILEKSIDSIKKVSKRPGGSDAAVNLNIDRIKLHNFGPYGGDPIEYPISKRGLVLIRGQSSDGTGADSNGAGKTSLAMSTLWGLTGSMDPRLVSDGRAADVAYQCGGGRSRTASVTVCGTVNGEEFEIVRQRGAGGKKSDLSFTLGGTDLTTQSVKDTQAVIDSTLGIGGGLIQRCSFFGQHASTLQGLLGLTDGKLKGELSALVDMELWTRVLTEVREKGRVEKDVEKEIMVEIRVREADHKKLQSTLNNIQDSVHKLSVKLNETRSEAQKSLKSSTDNVNRKFGNETSVSLSLKLGEAERDTRAFSDDKLVLLRRKSMEAAQRKSKELSELKQKVSKVKEERAQFQGSSSKANDIVVTIRKRLSQQELVTKNKEIALMTAQTNLKKTLSVIPTDLVVDSGVSSLDPTETDLEILQVMTESHLSKYSSLEAQYSTTTQSLEVLLKSYALHHAHESQVVIDNSPLSSIPAGREGQLPTGIEAVEAGCPTCGQPLQEAARILREVELKEKKISLKDSLKKMKDLYERIRQWQTCSQRYIEAESEAIEHQVRLKSLSDDLNVETGKLREGQKLMMSLDKRIAELGADLSVKETAFISQEKDLNEQLQAAEKEFSAKQKRVDELRIQVTMLRELESSENSAHGRLNATLSRLEANLDAEVRNQQHHLELVQQSSSTLQELAERKRVCAWNASVYSQLVEVFGPRGLQHFVFKSLLQQLENIANAYLQFLSGGGIRLVLQSDDEADRIVKSVMVRTADGSYQERGLSQLSGGQWRRVSLALDFSFAEMVRRRGLLRCNMVVMDEVLTHLDASGREAVGSVLRAMVDGGLKAIEFNGSSGDDSNEGEQHSQALDADGRVIEKDIDMMNLSRQLLGGGAYETVLVILQDLAATELEEAFDQIDTVVKETDISGVLLDGVVP